ncbi:Major Facilitator Superfamily protein [Pseudonocardia ammonioxydans]|uniref:Putative proline/betaine transporter n=1 Tax=Pseudonocardia ammonioxydans TaxID=260086 RepID=A0A1I5CBS8_PSUAM|nr:MFS transporter [Pseudonocardia ammonioxydans]SFN84458.1 Major Facilitator Superfamily protein [Pseudonocardia ammonioxydans]
MTDRNRVRVVRPSTLKRTISGTTVGNLVEWYDFGIFAFLVPTVSQVFFAGGSESLIATFTIFAVAFVMRPLGGLVFGPLGDRIGRRRVLAITILTMAIGTFAIGLIPDYETIGMWSAVLLLAARIVQGFSTGGEYAGAMTYLGEHAPDTRRGFLASFLEFGTLTGYVLGAAVATTITAVVPQEALLSWGWRIPFLIAGPLGLIGLYIRSRLEETPEYEQHAEKRDEQPSLGEQVHETVVRPWRPLLVCIGLVCAHNVANYTLTQYLPTYLTETVRLPYTPALLVVLVVMVVLAVLVTASGRLSDPGGTQPDPLHRCRAADRARPARVLAHVPGRVRDGVPRRAADRPHAALLQQHPARNAARPVPGRDPLRLAGHRLQPRGLGVRRHHTADRTGPGRRLRESGTARDPARRGRDRRGRVGVRDAGTGRATDARFPADGRRPRRGTPDGPR